MNCMKVGDNSRSIHLLARVLLVLCLLCSTVPNSMMSEIKLNRPYSVQFELTDYRNPRITNIDVLNAIKRTGLEDQQIKGIQLTIRECIVTLNTDDAKETLKTSGISLRQRHVTVIDTDRNITKVTLKDAPVEMKDICLHAMLRPYGEVVPTSMKRGVIKGTSIETGTRYLQMTDVGDPIPSELPVGRFIIRVFCDNGKTVCSHCNSAAHFTYSCPNKHQRPDKRCYTCQSPNHLAANCPNELTCNNCGREGHKNNSCPESSYNIQIEENGPFMYQGKEYDGVIPFRGENHPLSNLYIVKDGVHYDDKLYKSVEHGYKARKAIYFDRDDLTTAIEATASARQVMRMVDKELKGKEAEDWVINKQRTMKALVESKAHSCPEFHDSLIGSKGKLLVEATSHPLYASGLPGIEETMRTAPAEWPGQNKLGIIMMEVRDQLIKDTEQPTGKDSTGSTEVSAVSAETSTVINKDFFSNEAEASENKGTQLNDSIEDTTSVKTIIFGDSIIKGAPKSDLCVIEAESGASLSNLSNLIVKAEKEKNVSQAYNAVIALGINDLKDNQSIGATSALYSDACQQVRKEAPTANIFISALLPRKSATAAYKDFNEKVLDVNKFLKEYTKREGITFIGNSNTFKESDPKALYLRGDNSGIHLNREGQTQLLQIIEAAVQKHNLAEQKKRPRPSSDTPPSGQKEVKAGKYDNPSSD